MPLSFLDKGAKYLATIYRDADDAHWKTNPEVYTIEKFIVDSSTVLRMQLANGGGAAVSLQPAASGQLQKFRLYK